MERVRQLGAGIKIEKTDKESIFETVNIVLEDSNYKKNADKIAEGFHKCTGAKGAADKILQVCKGKMNR